ncbi:uncharacterized protein FIBRA_01574 [Fibroporia radiculosa]|uniref:glutathione transferase n=1 Tax=Fibroporia radiculosa TaxID=599839 RepID=J4I8K2_9APHY|nr:uncharacterized protein FIBRA_01574 [Fibroporia radiculosa]CCL99556.1 predicted protein [Fibroporia radiculosa]
MSRGKQFTLCSFVHGTNGWKVAFVLEELALEYETIYLDQPENKPLIPQYVPKCNPNARFPILIDHENNDFVVWESNAIITYLVQKYDTSLKISVDDPKEKIIQLQWLLFQASGQGPSFGQAAWFKSSHPETLPSAIERYMKETLRIFGVLETVLSRQEWLVGGKYTVADISFIPWNEYALRGFLADHDGFNFEKDFPSVYKWYQAMLARPSIAEVIAVKESMMTK